MEVHILQLFHFFENCKTLMSCESNPDVVSTPIQQQKRRKYITLRLGFLYHFTLSALDISVTMGSTIVSAGAMVIDLGFKTKGLQERKKGSAQDEWDEVGDLREESPQLSR